MKNKTIASVTVLAITLLIALTLYNNGISVSKALIWSISFVAVVAGVGASAASPLVTLEAETPAMTLEEEAVDWWHNLAPLSRSIALKRGGSYAGEYDPFKAYAVGLLVTLYVHRVALEEIGIIDNLIQEGYAFEGAGFCTSSPEGWPEYNNDLTPKQNLQIIENHF